MKSKIIKDDYVEVCKVDNKNSTVVIKYYTTKTTIHIYNNNHNTKDSIESFFNLTFAGLTLIIEVYRY